MRVQGISQPNKRRAGNEGWVYVLSNKSMPGMLKIGLTTREPDQRARELSGSTGVPTPFVIEHSRYVSDCKAVEREIHQRLDRYRVGKNREFFQMTVADATRAVDSAAVGYALGEARRSGCLSTFILWMKWLIGWPVLGPIWLWKRGLWGKAGAVTFVFLLASAIVSQGPLDEESVAATATMAAFVPQGTVVTRATVEALSAAAKVATSAAEAATATAQAPTATPVPPTDTPIPATETPVPTNTSAPTPTTTPVGGVRVVSAANLRAGPGTGFAVVRSAQAGDVLVVTGRNATGDWYELEEGAWVAAFLVEGASVDVPLAVVIPTLPTVSPEVVPATVIPVIIPATVAPIVPTALPLFQPPSPEGSSCDCSRNLYNCDDFLRPWDAQACYLRCNVLGAGDVHGLDRDSDGNACEWDY